MFSICVLDQWQETGEDDISDVSPGPQQGLGISGDYAELVNKLDHPLQMANNVVSFRLTKTPAL